MDSSKELLNSAKEAQQLFDQKIRNNNTFLVRQSPVKTIFDNPNQNAGIKRTDNTLVYTEGEFPGLLVETSMSVQGLPGTKILPTLTNPASGDRSNSMNLNVDNIVVHVSNLHFLGLVNIGRGPSNNLASAPTVIFQNCIFEQSLTNNGKVHMIGCEFREPNFGSVINFSGAANCFIIGCSNKGVAHVGAPTIIAETT